MRVRRKTEQVEEAAEAEAAAKPKKQAKPKAEPVEVFVVTTPHGDGMRVYGVYSSEDAAASALEADTRNRLEARALDAAPE